MFPWLQKTITNRLKDLELFSAGLAQQMLRRQDNLIRTISVLQTGTLYMYMVKILVICWGENVHGRGICFISIYDTTLLNLVKVHVAHLNDKGWSIKHCALPPYTTDTVCWGGGGGGDWGHMHIHTFLKSYQGLPQPQYSMFVIHVCFVLHVSHLAVGEVSHTLDIIKNTIDRCMTLAHKLNFLLPERDQLEEILICPQVAGPDEDDSSVELKEGDLPWSYLAYVCRHVCFVHIQYSFLWLASFIQVLIKILYIYVYAFCHRPLCN